MKKQVDGEYVILSGIDQVNILQKGNIDDVKRETEKRMLEGKPGGKFIMQPADFLEYDTPENNIEAYVQTALGTSNY